jgi:hypothetical protein
MLPIDGFIVWVDLDGSTSTCFLSWAVENVMEVWSKLTKTTIWDLNYGMFKWNFNGLSTTYLVIDEYCRNYVGILGGLHSNMKGTLKHILMILWTLKPLNGIYGLTKDNYAFCHSDSIAYSKD